MAIVHAEGNRNAQLRADTYKNVMRGIVSHLLEGAEWYVPVDEEQIRQEIDLDQVARLAVALTHEYSKPEVRGRVWAVVYDRAGATNQALAGKGPSDLWTALRKAALALPDLAAILASPDELSRENLDCIEEMTADNLTVAVLDRAELDFDHAPVVDLLEVFVGTEGTAKELIKPFDEKLTDDQIARLLLVAQQSDPAEHPQWLAGVPEDWNYPKLWDEAMGGAWVQQQCRRAATKKGADPQDIHDAAQELKRLFTEQVARRMRVGYVLDVSPYRPDVLPTTWWLSIIKPKTKDAWRKTLRNRREFPVDTTTRELPPRRLPDEGSEYLENLFDVVLDDVVDGLEQFAAERKILSSWSSEDAGRILQAAKRWLYTETGILDSRDPRANRKLEGNIQKPCTEHLREAGWLRETRDEKQACRVAGVLVEAAFYHALHEGAGGFPSQRRYLEKLVEAVAKRNPLLNGWSEADAQAIVTATQSWLIATRDQNHDLDGTAASQCSSHLLTVGQLRDTHDEALACRIAGSLAEAALNGANHAV